MRDLEHLALYTLCMRISEVTGIPSGRVMAKMPDIQFVNKVDGTQNPSTNETTFPCIGMKYCGDVKYKVNRDGTDHLVFINNTMTRIYKPLGEIWIPITIYLFTNSRKEQRELGNKIGFYLATNTLIGLLGDEIPGEYISIIYESFRDLNELRPYVRAYDLKINGRVLEQIDAHLIEEINTSISTTTNNINFTAPDILTNTITGDSYTN